MTLRKHGSRSPTTAVRQQARYPLLRYFLSAIVSVAVNLCAQEAVIQAFPSAPLMMSIIFGTGVGFVVKYVIDKIWTFRDRYTTGMVEARKMSLSGLFSVATTVIFWGFELGFLAIWGTDFAKYTGGALGLAIGYLAKFMLDREYVFRERAV